MDSNLPVILGAVALLITVINLIVMFVGAKTLAPLAAQLIALRSDSQFIGTVENAVTRTVPLPVAEHYKDIIDLLLNFLKAVIPQKSGDDFIDALQKIVDQIADNKPAEPAPNILAQQIGTAADVLKGYSKTISMPITTAPAIQPAPQTTGSPVVTFGSTTGINGAPIVSATEPGEIG
jgi:hypothetical protein